MIDVASTGGDLLALSSLAALAAAASAALIAGLAPWLKLYALVRPNARSSHREPTPQGGGAAVVAATLAVAWLGASYWGIVTGGGALQLTALTTAVLLLAIIGAIDDIRGLGAPLRLVMQCAAVALVVAALPADWRVIAMLPWWVERTLLLVGIVWFVNLTNFMDGIDWMTVAEIVPITGAIALLGVLGILSPVAMLVALALFGAILGFAPFNKPVAKLFLGDVGSLPIGLVTAWLLLELAHRGHLAAALLLPLYYLADATLTLLRRLRAGEPVWQAHRTHFYQRATAGGHTVIGIIARVILTNLALAALAFVSIAAPGSLVSGGALALGAALVGLLLASFARGPR